MFDNNRFGLITGSRCSVLFPKRSAEKGQETYAKELANQMYFKFYDEKSSWQTDHGHLAESSAFEYYQQKFCKEAEYQPPFEMYDCYGGTADCITPNWGVDFKCPTSMEKWLDYFYLGVDEQQYHQCQMYMWLYDRPEWHICAYLLETEKMSNLGIVYPIDNNYRMIRNVVTREEGWSDLLQERGEKVILMRNLFYQKLKNHFTK
jgi:hypothetical protein